MPHSFRNDWNRPRTGRLCSVACSDAGTRYGNAALASPLTWIPLGGRRAGTGPRAREPGGRAERSAGRLGAEHDGTYDRRTRYNLYSTRTPAVWSLRGDVKMRGNRLLRRWHNRPRVGRAETEWREHSDRMTRMRRMRTATARGRARRAEFATPFLSGDAGCHCAIANEPGRHPIGWGGFAGSVIQVGGAAGRHSL